MKKVTPVFVGYMVLNFFLFYVAQPYTLHDNASKYALGFLFLQFIHSLEEQLGDFHSRWPLMKISRTQFAIFEILFQFFWFLPFLFKDFMARDVMLWVFPLLMFANGIWHVIWFWFFEKGKRYVPGLLTAPLFIVLFIQMYLTLLNK